MQMSKHATTILAVVMVNTRGTPQKEKQTRNDHTRKIAESCARLVYQECT